MVRSKFFLSFKQRLSRDPGRDDSRTSEASMPKTEPSTADNQSLAKTSSSVSSSPGDDHAAVPYSPPSPEVPSSASETSPPDPAPKDDKDTQVTWSYPQGGGQIWDQAYDSITTDDPLLVMMYEKVLHEMIDPETREYFADVDSPEKIANQTGHQRRQSQMSQLIKMWLIEVDRDHNAVMLLLKSNVEEMLEHTPEDALPWVSVCFPTKVRESCLNTIDVLQLKYRDVNRCLRNHRGERNTQTA